MSRPPRFTSSCACGTVLLEAFGPPIDAVACHCQDCRAAGEQIEALPGAPRVLDASGGTAFLVLRKDRMQAVRGVEHLRAFKRTATSPTSRYVAMCCHALMYIGFDDARPWVSMHRDRCQGEVPAVRMRVCTGALPKRAFPDDLPRHRGYPLSLMARLAWAGMAKWLGGADR